jgi:hypothetical protein
LENLFKEKHKKNNETIDLFQHLKLKNFQTGDYRAQNWRGYLNYGEKNGQFCFNA